MPNCKQCNNGFEVVDADREFYEKMAMPEPRYCPDCRQQFRWVFRNQNNLYRRKCDFTGEEMISLYSPDKPYTVYREDIWWGDQWDPLEYGRDFDFTRPFFDQYNELLLVVPRRGMHQDGTSEGSEYTTFGFNNRNCYLVFAGFYCEDVYYSMWPGMLKDSMDCLMSLESSLLYECVDCKKCYKCFYCVNSQNCQESYFLDDCRNCRNCICCKNLRNKEYHIYNKPVSVEEFESYKNKILQEGLLKERMSFDQWKLKLPNSYTHIDHSEDCSGDYIEYARNCHNCFDVLMGAEDMRHCQFCGWKGKDMMDCSMSGKESELLYQMLATSSAHRCAFVNFCRDCSDIYYSEMVSSSHNCFGCVGLKRKDYCILNKQYSKEEYEKLMPRIIEHMRSTGEWGEFFPRHLSPFGYNETMAQLYFPLMKEQALEMGFKWCDYETPAPKVVKVIPAKKLPERIKDIPDDILNWAVECEASKRPFKIIPQELKFYREHSLPIPRRAPEQRSLDRFKYRNPYKLWDRKCAKCQTDIRTSYSPDRPEIVYCESCYLKEVY